MNKSNSALCKVCQYRNICIPESLLPSLKESSVQKIASDLAQQISFVKGKLVYRQGDEFQSIFISCPFSNTRCVFSINPPPVIWERAFNHGLSSISDKMLAEFLLSTVCE